MTHPVGLDSIAEGGKTYIEQGLFRNFPPSSEITLCCVCSCELNRLANLRRKLDPLLYSDRNFSQNITAKIGLVLFIESIFSRY